MENKSFGTFSKELKDEVKGYINARIEYSRLLVYEKTSRIISLAVVILILALLGFFVLLFLSFTAALFIGTYLNNESAGFAIVTVVDIIILLLIGWKREAIREAIMQKVIQSLLEGDEKDDSTGTTPD